MKHRITLTFSLVLVCFALDSWAQSKNDSPVNNPTFIGTSIDFGYVLQHTTSLREIGDAYPVGFSIDWSKMLLQRNAWEFCNCLPKLGVELSYWDFGKPDILGQAVIALGYAEPYFRTTKNLNVFFRLGLGGTYLTTPFDAETNPLNETYSTHLSLVIMAGAGLNYRIDDSWNLRLLAKYNHTSNGGTSTPNKGINFPSLSLGVSKSLEPVFYPNYEKVEKREPPKQKERITLTHFSGWSNAAVGDKDKFYVFGFTGKYSRWIGRRSALTGGTEIILDYSRRELINSRGEDNNFIQAGVLMGHEFWLGKVTFGQQFGFYYFNDYRINDDIYQRYNLTYNFTEHFFAGFGLKAHGHVADFFDLRIGYRFN